MLDTLLSLLLARYHPYNFQGSLSGKSDTYESDIIMLNYVKMF